MGSLDIATALSIAFKYRFRALTAFGLCVAVAVALCVAMQTQYESTALMLVKIGRELIYRPDVGNTQAALPTIDKDEVIASNITLMRDAAAERAIINEIGLERLYPKIAHPEGTSDFDHQMYQAISTVSGWLGVVPLSKEAQAVRKLDGKLKIDTLKKTDVVAVTFMHPDPVLAARVANLIVDKFQAKVGQIYDNPNLQFLEKQVADQRTELQQAQDRLTAFRRENQVYNFDSQQGLLLQQRSQLDADEKAAQAHVTELKQMVATLTEQRAATPRQVRLYSETERHRAADDAQQQLLGLQLQEKQYAARYNDTYQPLMDVRNQIRLAQGALASARGDTGGTSRVGQNDTFQQIDQTLLQRQADLAATTARLGTLQQQLDTLNRSIDTVTSRERALQDMQNDIALRTDALKTNYDKLVEARSVAGLNQEKPASFSLVSTATPADLADPARPLPLLYIPGAAIVGAMLGLFVIFISARLNESFVTPAQAARRLNIPVLAVINYTPGLKRMGRVRERSGGLVDVADGRVRQAVPA